MARTLVIAILGAFLLAGGVDGQDAPLNVADPALLSGDVATAFGEATAALAAQLAAGYPLPRDITARLGWSTVEWATFVQGLLRGEGYDAVIVLHDDPGGLWLSLLVGANLLDGMAYVPVGLSLPAEGGGLGYIAWATEGSSFDARYVAFTSIVTTAAAPLPRFTVSAPREVELGTVGVFRITGTDPGGAPIGFVWRVDGDTFGADARPTMAIHFRSLGSHTVTVTGFDKSGGSSTQAVEVSVVAFSENCSVCH